MDDYRFHDAIHLGFMAVLGWSPVMRSLLRIKRKSSPEADECEDGARAIFAEEGLAAVLSRLAPGRTGFLNRASIDGDVIEIARAATTGLEAEALPGWQWQVAICQGFRAMCLLGETTAGIWSQIWTHANWPTGRSWRNDAAAQRASSLGDGTREATR